MDDVIENALSFQRKVKEVKAFNEMEKCFDEKIGDKKFMQKR